MYCILYDLVYIFDAKRVPMVFLTFASLFYGSHIAGFKVPLGAVLYSTALPQVVTRLMRDTIVEIGGKRVSTRMITYL
jgi:hypothetical protein